MNEENLMYELPLRDLLAYSPNFLHSSDEDDRVFQWFVGDLEMWLKKTPSLLHK